MKNSIRQTATFYGKFVLLSIAFSLIFSLQSCKKDDVTIDPTNTEKFKAFDNAMQKLWADHMQWTYKTVEAFFHEPDALNSNLARLIQNQKDIGSAIVPYYGQDAGDQLTELLIEHIQLAVPVLTAAKENNEVELKTALDNWYVNAKEIGDFLNGANPTHWTQHDMHHMMEMHIDQTVAYSVALLQNDHNKAIQLYDEAFDHMTLIMSRILSEGIAKQFPNKF